MDPPTIPRMPPFEQRAFWAGIVFLVFYMVLYGVFEPRIEYVLSVEFSMLGALYVYVAVRRATHAWQIRRAIRVLRSFDASGRDRIYGVMDDEHAKAYFEYHLADHGEPETAGLVERFRCSPVDMRESALMTWASALGAVGLLVTPLVAELTPVVRAVLLGSGVVWGMVAWELRRRHVRLARVFEISPFGLTEILADGSTRRLLWGYGLELRNRLWRRRIELSPSAGRECIDIPYRLVGFERLTELIIDRGGFGGDHSLSRAPSQQSGEESTR